MPGKRHVQFCGLARALDHVGDRWTLLVVRELLLGPKRYGELLSGLPGIATNLLADRLRQMRDAGLLVRGDTDGGETRYELTDLGRGLEPAVLALVRWGAVWMLDGPGDDHVDDRWGRLALRALLDGPAGVPGRGEVEVLAGNAEPLTVRLDRAGRSVLDGPSPRPRAVVRAPLPALLAAVAGVRPLPDDAIEGNAPFARTALTVTPSPGRESPWRDVPPSRPTREPRRR
jgi:DNA-binding HxlR family transcriptional regulator